MVQARPGFHQAHVSAVGFLDMPYTLSASVYELPHMSVLQSATPAQPSKAVQNEVEDKTSFRVCGAL